MKAPPRPIQHLRQPTQQNSRHQLQQQPKARFRPFLKTLVMGGAGFASAFLLWEGILQLTTEASQGITDHPVLGKIDRPGQLIHTREGFNRTQLNSLGMRAPEPAPKQPGEYRILMLGDSFTRADEVSDGISFSDRIQTHFDAIAQNPSSPKSDSAPIQLPRKLTTEKIQIINAGKPSASPASYLYAASFHSQTFAPDSTVIQLTEHDFTLDMSNEASEFYLEPVAKQRYQVRRNKAFGSAEPLAQRVMEKAPWLNALMQSSVLRIGGRNLSTALSPTDAHSAEVEPTLTAEEERQIKTKDAAMVRWSIQQLKAQFPNVVVLFIPAMSYQDAGDISSASRNAAIEQALIETTAEQGIPLLNMRPDFLTHYRAQGTHLKGFNNTLPGEGHLNTEGHRLVAQRLIDFYAQPNSPLKGSSGLEATSQQGAPPSETTRSEANRKQP